MSNAQVGTVYQQIIADVVESSRVDFEEGGVDEGTLEELRLGWQQKLSQLNVATFPWDPKPEPTPVAQPPTLPSNTHSTGPSGSSESYQQPPEQTPNPTQNLGQNGNGPRIKSEPGLENQQPYPVLPGAATTAQQRAAQHLHQNYGQRAAASINAIQQGLPQAQQQNVNGGPNQDMRNMQQMQMMQQQQQQRMAQHQQQQQQASMNGTGITQGNGQPRMTPEQFAYRQQMMQQAQQRIQQQAQQNGGSSGVAGAQTDGASDVIGVTFDANGKETDLGRLEIDGLIRERVLAMGASMEGGGLMLPLSQASTKVSRKSKVPKAKNTQGRGQVDGGDEDDDDEDKVKIDDEDAINSDLDDPDDGLGEEDDDDEGELGQIMLCMYDKVQRVKNKWKCVMKDGVLTVNGKEYVFHKASGEYEW